MARMIILIFIGGALGAMLREFAMITVPNPVDNFPLDILAANLVASFLLGLVTGLCRKKALSEQAEILLGTGVAGGLSTFSSFIYGAVVLMSASAASAAVAATYVVISLALGYFAVVLGLKLGGQGSDSR